MKKRKIIQVCAYTCKNPGVDSSAVHGHIVALCDDGTLWLKHMEKPNGWIPVDISEVTGE